MQRPEPASTELMKDREVQEALLRLAVAVLLTVGIVLIGVFGL